MTLRSITLAFALGATASFPALAQVPYIQVCEDDRYDMLYHCGQPSTLHELVVVLRYVPDDVVSAVDFSVHYPPGMIWLADNLPDPGYVNNEVVIIGSSPAGVAVAWHSCCMQSVPAGTQLVVLRPLILWTANCDLDFHCDPITVGGYTPLGKTAPSYIRASDFTEHAAVGIATYRADCITPVEPTTWGKVKSLYR
jgi:hypothetical protein